MARLANKNIGCPVKLAFQTCSIGDCAKLRVAYLKSNLTGCPMFHLVSWGEKQDKVLETGRCQCGSSKAAAGNPGRGQGRGHWVAFGRGPPQIVPQTAPCFQVDRGSENL